jgi:hypothetical protein
MTTDLIDSYDRFKDNQTVARDQMSEKPIPFTKLQELRSKKLTQIGARYE